MKPLQGFFERYRGLLLGLATIILAAVGWTFFSYNDLRTRVKEDLTYSVALASASVSHGQLASLSYTESDNEDPVYRDLYDQFLSMGRVMAAQHIKGIYAMKLIGEEVRFIVDSAPVDDPYHSPPGTVYEQVPPALLEVARDGQRRFTGPYTDEYGSYYSVFMPIGRQEARTATFIGADIEVSVFNALLRERLWLPLSVFLSILLLYVLLWLYVSQRATLHEAEREQEQRALRSAQERELLLMNIGEGVVACDAAGKVVYANRFARQTACAPDAECVGKDFRQHWPIVDAEGTALPDGEQPLRTASVAPKEGSVVSQRYLRRTDGSLMPVAVSVAAINEGSGKRTVVMSFRDRTKEAEIDRMKTDFVSVAVHQLKTPLTSLKWSVEMLSAAATPRSKDDQEAIATITEVTEHLHDLVSALLNITRIESGRMMVEPVLTDLGALLGGAMKEVEARINEKRMVVTAFVAADLPKVNVDPRLVREVYKNFLTNAVKYTPAGGRIDVRMERHGEEAVCAVKDSGFGIPQDEQGRLFDKFFRARNVIALPEEGTGLGLYFAREIAEVSGGRIWFQSVEGRGSTFFFALPLAGSPVKQGEIRIS